MIGKFDLLAVLIRGFKILRVIRLINLNKQVKEYFYTLIILFPSLYNLGSLVMIMLVIFSVIGMELFGTYKHNAIIDENNNFKNFISSFILIIRVTTNDDWGDLMYQLASSDQNCKSEQDYNDLINNGPQGCGNWMSYPYFLTIIMLNRMIIMNLFIAVVVDTFTTKTLKSDKIDDEQLKRFFNLWGHYDREIRYYISPSDLVLLMLELPYPLGLKGDPEYEKEYDKRRKLNGNIYISHSAQYFTDDKQCIRILDKLNIICRNDKIQLIDVLILISKRSLRGEITDKSLEEINKYRRLTMKLEKSFINYDKRYKNIISEHKATESSLIIAKNVIKKHLVKWRLKKSTNNGKVSNGRVTPIITTNHNIN